MSHLLIDLQEANNRPAHLHPRAEAPSSRWTLRSAGESVVFAKVVGSFGESIAISGETPAFEDDEDDTMLGSPVKDEKVEECELATLEEGKRLDEIEPQMGEDGVGNRPFDSASSPAGPSQTIS